MGKKIKKKQNHTLIVYSDLLQDTVTLEDIDESIQKLITFDDMIVEKNLKQVEELFIRGRKLNCSIIFISQSYFGIPQMIRQNSNYFILTPGINGRNLINIATDHSGAIDSSKFRDLYRSYTTNDNFMLIDTINNKFYQNLGLN